MTDQERDLQKLDTAAAVVVPSTIYPGINSLRTINGDDVRRVLSSFAPGEEVVIVRRRDFERLVLEAVRGEEATPDAE